MTAKSIIDRFIMTEGIKTASSRSSSRSSSYPSLKQREGYKKASRTRMRRGYTETAGYLTYYYFDNARKDNS